MSTIFCAETLETEDTSKKRKDSQALWAHPIGISNKHLPLPSSHEETHYTDRSHDRHGIGVCAHGSADGYYGQISILHNEVEVARQESFALRYLQARLSYVLPATLAVRPPVSEKEKVNDFYFFTTEDQDGSIQGQSLVFHLRQWCGHRRLLL